MLSLFYHYLELHHSQTHYITAICLILFYHYLELHHSQTEEWMRSLLWGVLPLSGITSLSNTQIDLVEDFPVLPLSGITSLSNPHRGIVGKMRVLPLSGITSLSNCKNHHVENESVVLPLSGITSLSNSNFNLNLRIY